jgi:UPF0755 protein
LNSGLLDSAVEPDNGEQLFIIESGESVTSISNRLQTAGLIKSSSAFRTYLIYTGLDTSVQAGNYRLNPAMTSLEIALALQDATPSEVPFIILPGWRIEEIAAALPTSGLGITADSFLTAAVGNVLELSYLISDTTVEGFLFPDSYTLPRQINADQFVSILLQNFDIHLRDDLREGFNRNDMSIYQAVILASIVEREAVVEEESPMIASVFLNRLKIGMKLDSDPTVQYALGYNTAQATWWTNPLSLTDLQLDSPYNTYRYAGLPPAPICNPAMSSLQAVAFPAQTPYFFFRARCDGTGLHAFAETFEEHQENACP